MAKRGKVKFPTSVESIDRHFNPRKYKWAMFIFCEDEKTEVAYFEEFLTAFPERTVFLKTVGTGMDPLGVVKKAIADRSMHLDQFDAYPDEMWVVFDVDDADKDAKKGARFEEALAKANLENLQVASSNEVFELWLLLHFIQIDPTVPIPRKTIYQTLENVIRLALNSPAEYNYEHGNIDVVKKVIELGSELRADQNAIALEAYWKSSGKKFLFTNPRTHVFKLVKRLRELIDFHSYEP